MNKKLLVGHKGSTQTNNILVEYKEKTFRNSFLVLVKISRSIMYPENLGFYEKYELISLFIYRCIMWMENSADSDQLASNEAS